MSNRQYRDEKLSQSDQDALAVGRALRLFEETEVWTLNADGSIDVRSQVWNESARAVEPVVYHVDASGCHMCKQQRAIWAQLAQERADGKPAAQKLALHCKHWYLWQLVNGKLDLSTHNRLMVNMGIQDQLQQEADRANRASQPRAIVAADLSNVHATPVQEIRWINCVRVYLKGDITIGGQKRSFIDFKCADAQTPVQAADALMDLTIDGVTVNHTQTKGQDADGLYFAQLPTAPKLNSRAISS